MRARKIFLWLSGVCLIFGLIKFIDRNSCHSTLLSVTPGPGNIDARVIDEMCYSDFVHIELKHKDSKKGELIFSYGPGDHKILLNWVDKTHLEVTALNIEEITYEVVQWGDIHIAYHFDKISYP